MSDIDQIGTTSLTMFDDWIHDTYGKTGTDLGEVVLVRSDDQFADFVEWVKSGDRPIAYDIESAGLFHFSPGWKLKLVQFGDEEKAFCFVAGEPWADRAVQVITDHEHTLLAHNSAFDALGLEVAGAVPDAFMLLDRTVDTMILSHLTDPRNRKEGGVGHGLKDLSGYHVDPNAPTADKALKDVFRSQKWKIDEGYAKIPADHPTYVHYGGMDVILTARLYPKLQDELRRTNQQKLVDYEHDLLRMVTWLERRGIRVDVPYAEQLRDRQLAAQEDAVRACKEMGCKNPFAPKDVGNALVALGAKLTDRTDGGQFVVDKPVLTAVIAEGGEPGELAEWVMKAKNEAKWRESYVEASLNLRDPNDRVHPKMNSIQARTARMSVTSPPLQQLPSGDALIRTMFLGEEGHRLASIDFMAVELRVLAALSEDARMLRAFSEGDDLHQITADLCGIPRKIAKNVNFGKVYGAGPKTLSKQANMSEERAREVIDLFDESYEGVTDYGQRLSRPIKTGARGYVITATGRHLPVDQERSYAALNYVIQSTARDVLGRAMLALRDADLWQYALLPIHDEVLFSFPAEDAEELCVEAGAAMEMKLKDVAIMTEPDLGGNDWGSLYRDGDHDLVEVTPEARARVGTIV